MTVSDVFGLKVQHGGNKQILRYLIQDFTFFFTMSDSFNAHELLSKLRAKSSNSTAASVVSEPPKRGNVVPDFDQKPSPVKTPAAVTTNIRAPISLTLTPSQRQENLNARLELEREIKRLQDEVASLLSENLQLKQDKEDVEQQFIEFRTKSEKTITDLRGNNICIII